MKKQINGIIVVEGKSDVALLSNFIDAEFVTTNGSDIPFETISYLKEASKNKEIIVLTDPDSPGKRIRDVLDQNIPNLVHCFIEKSHAIRNGKVGVAECDMDEIFRALENKFINKVNKFDIITMSDLYDLGLSGTDDSFEKRNYVCHKLNLGFGNAKTLLKRLNSQGITKEEIGKILNE